jgi:hypothetical protein
MAHRNRFGLPSYKMVIFHGYVEEGLMVNNDEEGLMVNNGS